MLTFIHNTMENEMHLLHENDIVVSNPPYLSETHYRKHVEASVKRYETKQALVGGEDGLTYVKLLAEEWEKR